MKDTKTRTAIAKHQPFFEEFEDIFDNANELADDLNKGFDNMMAKLTLPELRAFAAAVKSFDDKRGNVESISKLLFQLVCPKAEKRVKAKTTMATLARSTMSNILISAYIQKFSGLGRASHALAEAYLNDLIVEAAKSIGREEERSANIIKQAWRRMQRKFG